MLEEPSRLTRSRFGRLARAAYGLRPSEMPPFAEPLREELAHINLQRSQGSYAGLC